MENIKEVIEAIVFAAGDGVEKSALIEKIPELTTQKLNSIAAELKKKYSGESGIVFIEFNGKLQFTSNPKYGETVAEVLTPLKEKELTKALLEVLSAIAYKQPITKLELDEIRGVSSEYALDGLMKAKLIKVVGRRDTVGRPLLYGTTDEFLKKFNLETLDDLPDLVEVMEKVQLIYQPPQDTGLFHSRTFLNADEEEEAQNELGEGGLIAALKEHSESLHNQENGEEPLDESEIPDFLKDEDIEVYD
jgi:segregation and condensation protein B